MIKNIMIVDHPLVQHKLSLMRAASTPSNVFRQLAKEVALFLGYEVLRDLPLKTVIIETPLQKMSAPWLSGKKLVLVPILRAGQGLLDGMLELSPSARLGHIGLENGVPAVCDGRPLIEVDGELVFADDKKTTLKNYIDEIKAEKRNEDVLGMPFSTPVTVTSTLFSMVKIFPIGF